MDARTSDALIELKTEGYRSIYYIDVMGLDILFRPLTFHEYEMITDLELYLDGASINDAVLKITVLFSTCPNGIAEWISECKYAFVVDHIAQCILNVSGFQDKNTFIRILGEKRKKAHEIQSLIEIFICTAFKNVTINEIRNMTLEDQLEFFAKAEEALGKPVDFNVIFNGNKKRPKNPYPVPEGMQSSTDDMLSPDAAHKFNF